jgi:competence protein ComEA
MKHAFCLVAAVVALGLLTSHPAVAAAKVKEGAVAAAGASAAVNINTASAEELNSLPGIGPALAKRIVDYRREHGPFAQVDDLLAVKGIGPKMLDKIRDRLSVGVARDTR